MQKTNNKVKTLLEESKKVGNSLENQIEEKS